MKNKKLFTVAIAVMLSAVMLTAFALTGNAAGNAYEQFKLLLREEPVQMNNVTADMNIGITDNGNELLNASGSVKVDKEANNMSGQFQISGTEGSQAFEMYKNGDVSLFRLAGSENWYQPVPDSQDQAGPKGRFSGENRFERDGMKENANLRESLMDALMGDLKDQVALVESNGLKTFSLTLDQGNMPVLLQTAFQAGNQMHKGNEIQDIAGFVNLPQELRDAASKMMGYRDIIDISSDRKLEAVKVAITVDQNNQPAGFEISANFSGTGSDGTAHAYGITCKVTLSAVNSTVPDVVDVNPSSITTIDAAQFKDCEHEGYIEN